MIHLLQNKADTFKMMFRETGRLLIVLGYSMAVPLLVSLIYGEYYTVAAFAISSFITLLIGFILHKGFKTPKELLKRHALIIAGLGWLSVAIMGALPYLITAFITPLYVAQHFIPEGFDYMTSLTYFKNPLHAFFESMSAFTTTGLSMAVHEPSIGKGLLFYRSFCTLLGGAGIIVLTLAVLGNNSSKITYLLYGSESTGERLQPTIIGTTRAIWKIYLGVTLFLVLYLFIGTWIILPGYNLKENLFDSVNHAMTGMSTAGFSTLDDSIAGYNSKAMDMLYLLPMILGAFSLTFYVKVFYLKQYEQIWKNLQTKAIVLACIFGSIIMSVMLLASGAFKEPFRIGIFQFVSALSTTGWQTTDVHTWNGAAIVFISTAAMIVGGATGSTAGGIKIIRALLLLKGSFRQVVNNFFTSNAIKVFSFNGKRMLPEELNQEFTSAAAFTFLYVLFVLLSALATYYLTPPMFTFKDALFESASAQGTVGLSCGITAPGMSPALELIYIFQMWLGRLEIIPVLVLLRAVFFGSVPRIA